MRDVSVIKDCSGMIKHTFGGGRVGLGIESRKVGGRTCQLELSGEFETYIFGGRYGQPMRLG